jgi:hypothetical protein
MVDSLVQKTGPEPGSPVRWAAESIDLAPYRSGHLATTAMIEKMA